MFHSKKPPFIGEPLRMIQWIDGENKITKIRHKILRILLGKEGIVDRRQYFPSPSELGLEFPL
jgi:hypothetical protein